MSGRALLAVAVLVVVLGWALSDYSITIANYVGLYSLVVLGVVMLTGVGGVMSFGQSAFVGLSAYASAFITLRLGFSPWLGLAAALALVIASAALLGSVTLRLSGHYLPLSTIAWGLSVYYLFVNLDFLGGQTGITDIPPIWLGPLRFETGREFYVLIWACVLAALLLFSNMLDSRAGRAMRSVRRTRELAESFGINTVYYRFIVFLYAAVCAAVSGWLYAHMLRFLNPTPFNLTMGIEYLFMAVIGGVTNIWGALLGAGIVTVLREWLQNTLPRLIGQPGNFEIVIFGALVIVLLQVNRDAGLGVFLEKLRRRPKPGAAPAGESGLPKRDRPVDAAGAAILEVAGVGKSFFGVRAVDDISFDVGRREIVAVIGPNGAGKTTLFNVITGLLTPDAGHVKINGRVLPTARPRETVRLGIARTFQHVHLVPELTVLENVMLGAHIRGRSGSVAATVRLNAAEERQMRTEAARQLTRIGLGELANAPATSLALGQQRLLEIARALCADPDLLLLDEPAAGLRLQEKQQLATLLRELRAQGLTLLLVEHDMDFVMKLVDRIVVMNFGQKLFEGVPAEVRAHPAVIEAYLGGVAA